MPSVYTIEGTRKRRKKRKGGKRTAQQARFAKAAKECKGQSSSAFKSCMKQKLRRG